jgi:hypothetical protein
MMTYDDYQSKLFLGIFPPLRLWHKVPYRLIPGTIYASIVAKLSLVVESVMLALIDKLDSRDMGGDNRSFYYYISGEYEEDQIIKAQQKIIGDIFETCHKNIA